MEHCRNEWNAVGTHGTLGWAMEQAQPGPADNAPPEVPGRNAEAWAEPLGARTLCPGRIRNDEALRSTKIWNARSKPKASAKQGKASARGPRAEGGEGELQRRGREGASMPPPRAGCFGGLLAALEAALGGGGRGRGGLAGVAREPVSDAGPTRRATVLVAASSVVRKSTFAKKQPGRATPARATTINFCTSAMPHASHTTHTTPQFSDRRHRDRHRESEVTTPQDYILGWVA